MSAETRSFVVRQLTRVSGLTDHSSTHCGLPTACTRVASGALSAALAVLAAEIADAAD
jgi:hypothetical protein